MRRTSATRRSTCRCADAPERPVEILAVQPGTRHSRLEGIAHPERSVGPAVRKRDACGHRTRVPHRVTPPPKFSTGRRGTRGPLFSFPKNAQQCALATLRSPETKTREGRTTTLRPSPAAPGAFPFRKTHSPEASQPCEVRKRKASNEDGEPGCPCTAVDVRFRKTHRSAASQPGEVRQRECARRELRLDARRPQRFVRSLPESA